MINQFLREIINNRRIRHKLDENQVDFGICPNFDTLMSFCQKIDGNQFNRSSQVQLDSIITLSRNR